MKIKLFALFAALALLSGALYSQVTSGEILGVVQDSSGGGIADATVTVRSLDTNAARSLKTGADGYFRFPQLPVGSYEVLVEKPGFAKYVQRPIVLRLNQNAEVRVGLQVASVTETISVSADATLINTTNAEVGANFDSRRVSELPLAPNRNILNLALGVPGVSQQSAGQSTFATGGVAFSVNGMRTRSNNFMIDGQDSNDASVTGLAQQIQNPDIVAEFRLITNQFAPEYGRAAGSVVNIITKSGSNTFHGSAFWFHNDNNLNARNNLNKALVNGVPRFASAPWRIENQFGGTLGGPIIKNKTFFFGSLQRWFDRQSGSGTTIRGVPTEAGRAVLTPLAATRPQIKALLDFLPAAQAPIAGLNANINAGGQALQVPLGSLSGAANEAFDDWQWSGKVDHRFNDKHQLSGRSLYDDRINSGSGQKTPPGLTTIVPQRRQSYQAQMTSSFSPTVFNELRLGYLRYTSRTSATDTRSESIPNLEVVELGLTGFNADVTRTAIGLASNLPQFDFKNTYQLTDTVGWLKGNHSMKFGIDFRKYHQTSFFYPNTRGRIEYTTLQNMVDDVGNVAIINSPLPGGQLLLHFKFFDYFFFLQDEWRVKPNLTFTYGIRYESPGNAMENLRAINAGVLAAAGGDQRYGFAPVPPRDTNNWAPRFGFNYRVGGDNFLTGNGKLVLRGGYSRTYDVAFLNIALNVATAFPFSKTDTLARVAAVNGIPNSYANLRTASLQPIVGDPRQQTRTNITPDFRAPLAEQLSLNFQRGLAKDWAMTVGWVGTKGTGLFQTVDGNPTVPGSGGIVRVDPNFGVVRTRCNCSSSIYHSLQSSIEKRLSSSFAMAGHYTWSSFIDNASEIFNPSATADVAVSQDSFNRNADRARSTYDRPHRFTINGVYELPFMREQKGALGKVLGGWQVSPFLTFQSGAPFTALDGADPGGRLNGISGLVGNAIRANVNTTLDVSRMTVEDLLIAGGSRLFSRVTAANPLGNAGRNILRSDGIGNFDVGFIKNTNLPWEGHRIQIRAELYNATNTRNFGLPQGRISSTAFLDQWALDGGNRRILLGLRYAF